MRFLFIFILCIRVSSHTMASKMVWWHFRRLVVLSVVLVLLVLWLSTAMMCDNKMYDLIIMSEIFQTLWAYPPFITHADDVILFQFAIEFMLKTLKDERVNVWKKTACTKWQNSLLRDDCKCHNPMKWKMKYLPKCHSSAVELLYIRRNASHRSMI